MEIDWNYWLTLVGLAVGLAMDAFAVAIAVGLGLATVTQRHVFRLGFHFGFFQFMMPIIGWLAGSQLAGYIGNYDHWVAFALLGYVGGKMLYEAHADEESEPDAADPTRGLRLITLSVATSIDALAVGMSMALVGESVWIPSVVIGIITAGLTAIGISFGSRIGSRWGRWAETIGGLVLIFIGIRLLVGHLMDA
jgi:manganese efflux pump family protein